MRISRAPWLVWSAGLLLAARVASGIPVVGGFNASSLAACDDATTGPVALGFEINFFGQGYTSVYVNNNGNVTFGAALAAYTPFDLATTHRAIIAPFFADVDTRGKVSGVTQYGQGELDGHAAFGVTWDNVGYYGYGTDKLNLFQLLLVERADAGPGSFDIYFNYGKIQWEAGNASGGRAGLGGFAARAGYSNGNPTNSFELFGSATKGAFLDGGPSSLIQGSNIGEAGRYVFEVRNGIVSVPDGGGTLALLALAGVGLIQARRSFLLRSPWSVVRRQ